MISDIDEKIKHSILSSFADDTRLMKAISCAADVSLLQEDLDVVYDWTSINNMDFNGKKFEHIAYGKNEELKALSVYKSDLQQPIEIKSAVNSSERPRNPPCKQPIIRKTHSNDHCQSQGYQCLDIQHLQVPR